MIMVTDTRLDFSLTVRLSSVHVENEEGITFSVPFYPARSDLKWNLAFPLLERCRAHGAPLREPKQIRLEESVLVDSSGSINIIAESSDACTGFIAQYMRTYVKCPRQANGHAAQAHLVQSTEPNIPGRPLFSLICSSLASSSSVGPRRRN